MLGQSITFTLRGSGGVGDVFEDIIRLEYCPMAHFPNGGGHILPHYVPGHVRIQAPSMNCSSSVMSTLMQTKTITLPPLCFTLGRAHRSPLPLLHVDIMELVDLKDLVLLQLHFEGAPHMLSRV